MCNIKVLDTDVCEEYIQEVEDKKCYFCDKRAELTLGVALGFSGWDYDFCNKCLKEKSIRDLVDQVEEEIV